MANDDHALTLSEFLLYQTDDGLARVQVRLQDGTVWLTQKQLAELYQVTVAAISQHLHLSSRNASWHQRQLLSVT